MGYSLAFHLIIHKGDNQLVIKQKWYTETERIISHEVNVHLKVNWYELILIMKQLSVANSFNTFCSCPFPLHQG